MSHPAPTRSLPRRLHARWRRLRRFVLLHRRLLAAVLAALAVVTGVRAAALPATATTAVLVAATDLPGGSRLASADVTTVQLPVDAVPSGAVSSAESVAGRTLAAPVTRGEPLTDVRLVSPGLLDGYPGLVAAPVRIADPAAVRLLAVGDHVDLLAVSPEGGDAVLVAPAAPVVAVPAPSDADGLVGGALVVVAVPEEEAHALAEASVRAVLTLVLNR